MSNIKKQNNCILKYFEDYTDEELISMIESKSKLYSRLIDSEEKAIHILNNHARFFYRRNESFKLIYSKLLRCANLRGLSVDDKIVSDVATLDDIIARLKENCSEEVNLIDEYCYRYDGYCGNGLWNVPGYVYESGTIGADLKMHEVSELYDEIIEETINEYSNKKTLKRTK